MTIWQHAAAALSSVFKAVSDETVTYTRGNASNEELSVSFGKSEFEAVGEHGQILEVITEDIVLDTADLTLNDVVVKPQRGDKVVRVLPSGDTVTYEVCPPDKSMKPYKLSCQDLRMRIHLKRVANG